MKILKFIVTFSTAFLIGCGTVGVKERQALRKHVAKKEFDKAIKVLKKGDIKKDKNAKVLYFLERGRLHFGEGDYGHAAEWFEKAKKLIDDYYTKSISQKVASATLNENLENYYGEIYEVSALHYYLAKTYYHIYLKGERSQTKVVALKGGKSKKTRVTNKLSKSKRQQYLFAARAEILAWDSFYKDVQRSGRKTIFKSDLLVKLFGATIHEAIGSRADLNTALVLYQDAKKVLYTVSNILMTYNNEYKKYTSRRLNNLNKLVQFAPNKDFKPTTYQNDLKDFIDTKILNLTKRIRPSSAERIIKREAISKDVVKNTKNEKRNVTIILEEGLISEKKAEVVNIGLKGAMKAVKNPVVRGLIVAVGVPVLSYFAMNTLGLVPKNRAMTYNEFVYARNMSELAVTQIAIEFEIPLVEKTKMPKKVALNIYNKAGVKVATESLAVVAPFGDIARQNLEESASSRMLTKGLRVAMKHVVAIAAAYKTYKSMKDSGKGAFAGTVASVSYFAAAKGILASEKADLRYWSTLPSNIHMANLKLKKGDYTVKYSVAGQKGKIVEKDLGNLSVTGKSMDLFTYYVGKI
jgi:hypothetical protein